ncbi:MAG: hypothetical protein ACOCX1_00695 [Fimbriimonadaceae bacterium]
MDKLPLEIKLYATYCLLTALGMLAAAWVAGRYLVDPEPLTKQFVFLDVPMSLEPWRVRLIASLVTLPALLFCALNLYLPFYRGKGAWPIHLINVLLGAGSCVFTPICLPLAFMWFRPRVKRYYGA